MLKLCAAEVGIPQMIFNDCINSGMFPDCWKYVNVHPIHKKDNCQIIGNYMTICGKISL